MGDTYIKLNDALPEHRKIVAAGGDAGWLHICALAYASRNLTDGQIPKGVVPRLSDRKQPLKLARRLCEVQLWHETGHDCKRCPQPDVDEYVIHDYLEHQRSADHIDAIKRKRAEAGRAGGSRKAANANRSAKATGNQSSSNLLEAGQAGAQANGTPEAVTEGVLRTPQTDAATDIPPPPSAPAGGATAPAAPALFVVVNEDNTEVALEVTARTILGEYLDRCRKRPPDRVLGHLAREIKLMLDQPIDPDDIRRGVAHWVARGLSPAVLPSIVNEVMNGGGDRGTPAKYAVGSGSELPPRDGYNPQEFV